MKKFLLLYCFFILVSFGYAQSESKGRICFHFIDLYGSSVKPDKVEITDNEGNSFQLSTEYCFDYLTSNYAFDIRINDVNYYDYQKTYYTPIPKTDTIVLNNIIIGKRFFIKSETPVLTNDEIKYLQDFFSNIKNLCTSLSLEINIGNYDRSEFQSTIEQIFDLYLSKFSHKNHFSIGLSVHFKNDNLENVLYLFDCK